MISNYDKRLIYLTHFSGIFDERSLRKTLEEKLSFLQDKFKKVLILERLVYS